MKIGTDGVLLGAWTTLENHPNTVLDIGAGTGVIALLLAQRSTAQTIDAIELDENAYEQCVKNFEASQWADRLFCYHASFEAFYTEMDEDYDLIVSNPPFYSEEVSSGNAARDQARQNSALPFEQLFKGVAQLLSSTGIFSLIAPYEIEGELVSLAAESQLFPSRILRVKGNRNAPLKRTLLEFSYFKKEVEEKELVIETERHQFTAEYIDLTKDFYLKM